MALKLGKEQGNLTLSQMAKGDDGGYYTPTVSEDGNLSWVPSEEDMPAVPEVNIAGADGKPGSDGISPSVTIEQTDDGAVITIVDATGSTTATLKNGEPGRDGIDGKDGEPGKDGEQGPMGPQGETGEGVPAGGSAGQVLAKKSDTDYDTEWVDQTGGSGGSSYTFTDGLTETDGTVKWDLSDRIAGGDGNGSLEIGGSSYTMATGNKSFATGFGSFATGDYSFAGGYASLPSYKPEAYATSWGNQATGLGSIAFTYNATANIFGNNNASGNGAVVFGYNAGSGNIKGTSIIASGKGSFAHGCIGYILGAYGDGSHAEGCGGVAHGFCTHVEGTYPIKENGTTKQTEKGTYVHIIGNGVDWQDASRSNAYTLDWQGNGTFAGTVSSAGADYAEFFEWKDGNPAGEDRIGYIVTLDGDKIKLATDGDDILGIISGTATVLGDNAEWNWSKRFLADDFGRIIYEDYDIEHPEVKNEEGKVIEEAWTEHIHAPKKNPSYDASQPYINRRNRPEWSAVGMMGKLYVRDDGTAKVNGYVTAVDGIATASDKRTNMRVMKRVTDNIIQVCLK